MKRKIQFFQERKKGNRKSKINAELQLNNFIKSFDQEGDKRKNKVRDLFMIIMVAFLKVVYFTGLMGVDSGGNWTKAVVWSFLYLLGLMTVLYCVDEF
jgi:hypothetical protein